jgi:hypothetical protein
MIIRYMKGHTSIDYTCNILIGYIIFSCWGLKFIQSMVLVVLLQVHLFSLFLPFLVIGRSLGKWVVFPMGVNFCVLLAAQLIM